MERIEPKWLKYADGTDAVDMQVKLCTPSHKCGTKDRPSLQVKYPAGVTGTFALEYTNDPRDDVSAEWTAYDATAFSPDPTQPAGSADNVMLCMNSEGARVRGVYTPTSGGAAALPLGTWWSFTNPEA